LSILPIRIFPDPFLRKKSKEITEINKDIIDFGHSMLETMQTARGVGLAAPQVGKLIRMITIQVPEKAPMIMINPNLTNQEGLRRVEEGCLSVPGFTGIVERSIKMRYEIQLKERDDLIERLRDMKIKLSTKMVGESLEQHC